MNAFRIRQLLGSAAAILLLAIFAAGPVQAQRGNVTGQVTDKSNQQAVTGASVLVVGTNLQGRTNREGRYTITNVPAGQYQVHVNAEETMATFYRDGDEVGSVSARLALKGVHA